MARFNAQQTMAGMARVNSLNLEPSGTADPKTLSRQNAGPLRPLGGAAEAVNQVPPTGAGRNEPTGELHAGPLPPEEPVASLPSHSDPAERVARTKAICLVVAADMPYIILTPPESPTASHGTALALM